jgi:hypothetical protein
MASGHPTRELIMIGGTENIPAVKELITICSVC